MTIRKLAIVITIICIVIKLEAQENVADNRLSATEFNIPASPVFDLMAVTPSQVVRTSDIKDFKVDWSFKSWSLSPNISVQSQPIWETMYNRRSISKYQKASPFMRRLASTDFSLGTVRDETGDRRIGGALKMTLYREVDPLLEKGYYDSIEIWLLQEKVQINEQIKILETEISNTKDLIKKQNFRKEIGDLKFDLLAINTRREEQVNEVINAVVEEYWNAAWFDVGFGKVNSYLADEAGNLLSKRLNRNSALGVWVNAGKGVGKNFLVSGLFRTHFYDEQVNFSLINDESIGLDTTSIGSNRLYTVGANIRYGSPIFTFFTELIYEKRGIKTPLQAVKEIFITPDNFEIVPSSVDWTIVHPYRINFGGDWRLNKNLLLNFSMQTVFDKNYKLRTFLPVVGLACLMR